MKRPLESLSLPPSFDPIGFRALITSSSLSILPSKSIPQPLRSSPNSFTPISQGSTSLENSYESSPLYKGLARRPFTSTIQVTFPLLPHLNSTSPSLLETIKDLTLQIQESSFVSLSICLSELLESRFLTSIRSSSVYPLLFSHPQSWVHDSWVCLPTGLLLLSLTKQTYETLGLVGVPSRVFPKSSSSSSSLSPLKWIVSVDLMGPGFCTGKKGYSRVLWCFQTTLPRSWNCLGNLDQCLKDSKESMLTLWTNLLPQNTSIQSHLGSLKSTHLESLPILFKSTPLSIPDLGLSPLKASLDWEEYLNLTQSPHTSLLLRQRKDPFLAVYSLPTFISSSPPNLSQSVSIIDPLAAVGSNSNLHPTISISSLPFPSSTSFSHSSFSSLTPKNIDSVMGEVVSLTLSGFWSSSMIRSIMTILLNSTLLTNLPFMTVHCTAFSSPVSHLPSLRKPRLRTSILNSKVSETICLDEKGVDRELELRKDSLKGRGHDVLLAAKSGEKGKNSKKKKRRGSGKTGTLRTHFESEIMGGPERDSIMIWIQGGFGLESVKKQSQTSNRRDCISWETGRGEYYN